MKSDNETARTVLRDQFNKVENGPITDELRAMLLAANFLREISDSLVRIDENINLIENELGGGALP